MRYGIKPHTPWNDVLEIVKGVREKDADIIVTLGQGASQMAQSSSLGCVLDKYNSFLAGYNC